MAIQYTNTGFGEADSVATLQAELQELIGTTGGSIINPGDPNTMILDTRDGYDYTIDTLKLTEGYFTGGDGTLEASLIYTGSLADSNEKYYFNIVNKHPLSASVETQFSVAYGHIAGSGSNVKGATTNNNTLQGETEAVYKQFSNLLLNETEVTGGFKISQQGTHALVAAEGGPNREDKDNDIYVLVGKRARFKDRINKGTWTVRLSGSNATAAPPTTKGRTLHLCDDSKYNKSTFTVAGPRYNIISGSAGDAGGIYAVNGGTNSYLSRSFGWFYPDAGVLVFSAHELSASMPGVSYTGSAAQFHSNFGTLGLGAIGAGNGDISSSGLAPYLSDDENANNALKFVNCLRTAGGKATATASEKTTTVLRFRSEEDQTQNNYFCRIRSGALNFSNNPTFTSSSILGNGNVVQQVRNKSMWGNPTVYITGVGLYNNAGKLVAVAKLSTPIKKNFSSEATIKVKLTY